MKKILILLVTIGLLAWSETNAQVTKKITLKVAHDSSTESPMQNACLKFKEVLEKETKGAVEVQLFPNAQLGDEVQACQMIKLGTLDATGVSAGNMASLVPEVEIYNAPFIFRDMKHMYKVVDGPVGQRVAQAVEEKLDSVFLGYWSFGVRNTHNSKRPIRTPDDMKGLKIRVMKSPIMIDTFNAFGAQATTMSWGEVYSAIQQGVIDGGECDEVDMLAEKFYEVSKHVSTTGHLIGVTSFIFSKKVYDRLPPYIRTVVLMAGREATIANRKAQDDKMVSAQAELKKKGVNFYTVDQKLFKDKIRKVYENNAEKLGGMELIDLIASQ